MRKTFTVSLFIVCLALLAACSENTDVSSQSNMQQDLSTISAKTSQEAADQVEENKKTDRNFKSGTTVDLKMFESQLEEEDVPALRALENNLNALVTHDSALYQSGFANEKLANDMSWYLDGKFKYKFTNIESFEKDSSVQNQFLIIVLGQRLDTSLDKIEDLRMLYAIRKDTDNNWLIYTID
ncbi:hypothetical protein [Saccharibacillus sacchari]|uniref:hypothetical protein n=1 Tax=Saccharibacillus sacchari TaxID=456493 RepID=UPI00055B43A6|nr:hypothetical protein [Saccharibacillus sacchari]